jgi:hypothetical protein
MKLMKSCICGVVVCGPETWTVGKNEDWVLNVFETRCWRRMLKVKRIDRITNDEVSQRAKEERLLLNILKNRRHSWIWHIIRQRKKKTVNTLKQRFSNGGPRVLPLWYS